jgi:D-arginine dehydrogenase
MDSYDIVIVGGGIAGASFAARLVTDRRILVIEAEDLCGRHATGRSAAFLQASLGGDTPERRLTLASRPMFDASWPGSETPLLRTRGAIHLTHEGSESFGDVSDLSGEYRPRHLGRAELDRLIPGLRPQWTGAWFEGTCADIEVAAFHSACLTVVRRAGGTIRTDAELLRARQSDEGWTIRWRSAAESPASASSRSAGPSSSSASAGPG